MSEQEIITRYDPLLWKHVHNFKGRTTMKSIPDEDLIQTARMAFLQFIRTHDPQDWHKCRLTILHALCDEVQRYYPLKMPRAVFLNREKRGIMTMLDMDELEQVIARDDEREALEILKEIMEAAEEISPACVELVNLKRQGYNSREAAEALNRSKGWVSQTLSKLHRLYEE